MLEYGRSPWSSDIGQMVVLLMGTVFVAWPTCVITNTQRRSATVSGSSLHQGTTRTRFGTQTRRAATWSLHLQLQLLLTHLLRLKRHLMSGPPRYSWEVF
jgi:hypothetical protein